MDRPARPFRLTRFFSVASLLGVALVMACLLWAYRELALRQLIDHETRANADLARAFVNAEWNTYLAHTARSEGRTREAMLADPGFAQLDREVRQHMRGLQVAKVKIYDLRGITVYSTDPKQVGEDKSANEAFRTARAGGTNGQVTFRERFDAFEGVLNQRNLVASYVPLRGPSGTVQGVFEIYSDVTPLLEQQTRAQWQVAALVGGMLAALYAFLLGVVRKADRLLERQEGERAEREAQIRHQAFHDTLTGLPNRAAFAGRWAETLALAARHGRVCALMFIDLDRFKAVNDELGHAAGDQLLQAMALRIQAGLRESDVLFRMGGDEFTVILPEIADRADAAQVAHRIGEAVRQPLMIQGRAVDVGSSIGISVFPFHGADPELLLRRADAAMYDAKAGGRDRHAFYRAEEPA